jgi:hypothetical protein
MSDNESEFNRGYRAALEDQEKRLAWWNERARRLVGISGLEARERALHGMGPEPKMRIEVGL